MIDKKTAKKIAHAIFDAATVEEIALRFAALGLNFPDDPFSRCHLLAGYILLRRNRRGAAVAKELVNIARNNLNSGRTRPSAASTPRAAVMEKVDMYAAESVDLTDQQAAQIFYELIYAEKRVAMWRRIALVRYWRNKGKTQAWRA